MFSMIGWGMCLLLIILMVVIGCRNAPDKQDAKDQKKCKLMNEDIDISKK